MCYEDWKEVKKCYHCKKESLILKRSDYCDDCFRRLVAITKGR